MRRWIPFGLLGLLLSASLMVAARASMGRSPVYTVAAVDMNLQRDPECWVGRTVLLQGRVIVSYHWRTHNELLVGAELADSRVRGGGALPLAPGPKDSLWAFLRRLPLIGDMAPPLQALHRGAIGIVRVQLRAVRDEMGAIRYEATLLDAASGFPWE